MGILEPVRSAANSRLKAVRALRSGRDREHVLLEGEHLLEEALAAGAGIEWVLHDPETGDDRRQALLALAAGAGAEVVPCERRLLDAGSEMPSPPGLLAWGPRPAAPPDAVLQAARRAGLVLAAAGVQDPGNVGALVRVAAGLGCGGFLTLRGGASPWHPRALRGASGTSFRLPVGDRVAPEELVRCAATLGWELWEASARGAEAGRLQREAPVILLVGEEGSGVPPALSGACRRRIGIPLSRGVESLNVATAAAVLVRALAET